MLPFEVNDAPATEVIGGKSYLIRALDDMSFDELNLWWQAGAVRLARASFTPETTLREREETIRAAIAQARMVNIFSILGDQDNLPLYLDMMVQILWRSLRKDQPKLTIEDIKVMVRKYKDDCARAVITCQILTSGEEPPKPEDKGAADPTKTESPKTS